MPVTAAYNFVPLSDVIVQPEWSNRVSHDLPLQEGLCAEIEIEIVNETPLLVGAERQPGEAVEFFRHPDRRPAIPGSSLRGMLRNVIEIVSFSRLQLFDDRRLAIRDVRGGTPYLQRFVTQARPYESRAHGGWMRFEQGRWKIHPCDYARVAHETLADTCAGLGIDIQARFAKEPAPAQRSTCRTVRWKYALFAPVGLTVHTTPAAPIVKRQNGQPLLKFNRVTELGTTADARHAEEGRLVLTGQPGPRNQQTGKGKHFEFVFPVKTDPPLDVPDDVYRGFLEVNQSTDEATAFGYYSKRKPFGNLGTPVFFLQGADGQGAITAIGLSQLFKLPYPKRLAGYIGAHQRAAGREPLDFAETLFGLTEPVGDDTGPDRSLKGRVSFGDCRLADACEPLLASESFQRATILASPKPTYFPSYVKQTGGGLQTLLDEQARLSGWKRYPVHVAADVAGVPVPPDGAGLDAQTRLKPLAPGRRFTGTVRLHNVMPAELGAVLWALTWGGRDEHRHALGMGRAFGLGQVKAQVKGLAVRHNNGDELTPEQTSCSHWTRVFGNWMEDCLTSPTPPGWADSPQLKELLAMADPARGTSSRLRTMTLAMQGLNEFADAKQQNEFLRPHSG